MTYRRYGIYDTPPAGALADFGANWLGWELTNGKPRSHPLIADLPAPIADITARPRKYGLHGTIKPPFFLAPDTDEQGLRAALAELCETLTPVRLDGLVLSQIGRFLALKVEGDQTPLADLASTVVQSLDHFRAPPSEAELARRRKSSLSPRQDALLTQWGYPYVMDEFRFHITLTGPMSQDHCAQTRAALTPHIAPLLPAPFDVDSLTLVGEDASGMFHEIHRYALSG
ncbi:DUF1045 domain-containing protein [Shimia sp.]|uniref:DUF1045 domain-containing protein n=1 Tax=Shimia sp. TaxID=1954381 RepID=UPI003298B1D0